MRDDSSMPVMQRSKATSGRSPLRVPARIGTPSIELTEWGGRLPTQSYFPMYLGNGRDAMLINIMGSGEMHWECPLRSVQPLTRLLNTEWYRADRRDFSHSDLVYGQLMPFLDFSSAPMLRGDFVVPRDVKQFFDPRTATLATFISQLDNRTAEPLELRVQTFLTHEGLLVQRIQCIEAPSEGVQYVFTLGEPGPEYQNVQVPLIKPDNAQFKQDAENPHLVHYSSVWEQGRAHGFSLVGGVDLCGVEEVRKERPACVQFEQLTVPFHKGQTAWRILTVQDTREGGDPVAMCRVLLERIAADGIEGLHGAHCAEWERYFSTCAVSLPDPSAQFLYDVSRYLIKANLHPSGHLPMGTLPYLWQGAMFWDASFGHQALLSCGNFEEASSITKHLISLEEQGRTLAKKLGSPGVRLEWTVNLFDFSNYDPPTLQVHNNAVWAWALLLEASFLSRPLERRELEFVRGLISSISTGSPAMLNGPSPGPPTGWCAASPVCGIQKQFTSGSTTRVQQIFLGEFPRESITTAKITSIGV